jgi:hypothetical protein
MDADRRLLLDDMRDVLDRLYDGESRAIDGRRSPTPRRPRSRATPYLPSSDWLPGPQIAWGAPAIAIRGHLVETDPFVEERPRCVIGLEGAASSKGLLSLVPLATKRHCSHQRTSPGSRTSTSGGSASSSSNRWRKAVRCGATRWASNPARSV